MGSRLFATGIVINFNALAFTATAVFDLRMFRNRGEGREPRRGPRPLLVGELER